MGALGWFGGACDDPNAPWYVSLDPGCAIAHVGADIGSGVGSAIQKATAPIFSEANTLIFTIAALIVVVLLIIAFAPNVKHIVPHFV